MSISSCITPFSLSICHKGAPTLSSQPDLVLYHPVFVPRDHENQPQRRLQEGYLVLYHPWSRSHEALDHFRKGETLNPKKEYICHKIAQVYLKKGDHDRALESYERIPEQKRSPYILHGMGQSYMAKGEPMEAARKFNQAVQREPLKFYHYWDFALALIALGAKDQAIEALEKANHLFQQEHQKDYRKGVDKLEEVKSTLPPGNRVSFDKPSKNLGVTRFGVVTKYVEEKGYGFIKDDADGNRVFFHISHVNGRVVPEVGTRTRYVCEVTEKGLQAAKVWLLREN